MKKELLAICIAIFSLPALQASVVYQDFAPDKVFSIADGSLAFDLDGDMNNDITFNYSGSNSSDYDLSVSGPSLQFAVTNNPTNHVELLFSAKVINANLNWSPVGNSVKVSTANTNDLAGGNEFFIGVRFRATGGAFFYGWMLVELQSNLDFVIKSVAFENNLNKQIITGYTGAALLSQDELPSAKWELAANLVQENLNLSCEQEITHVAIYRLDGSMIREEHAFDKNLSIGISDLADGLYLLQARNSSGQIYQERFLKN